MVSSFGQLVTCVPSYGVCESSSRTAAPFCSSQQLRPNVLHHVVALLAPAGVGLLEQEAGSEPDGQVANLLGKWLHEWSGEQGRSAPLISASAAWRC